MSPTNIAWTEETWNPVTGCSHVSEGCRHCYAERLSLQRGWSKKPWTAQNATDNVRLHHSRLGAPFGWRRPRMVFVNSMSDLFHELVPAEFIDRVFAVMALTPWHTYQVLTKRSGRMRDYMAEQWQPGEGQRVGDDRRERVLMAAEDMVYGSHSDLFSAARWWTPAGGSIARAQPWPLPNLWLGVSVEDQKNADQRIPLLLQTPAAVRFLSCEPLLGPITFPLPCVGSVFWAGLHWVIAGGESGPGFRAMDLAWVFDLYDQCVTAGVPFFMKQDSGPRPGKQGRIPDELWVQEFPPMRQVVSA